MKRKTSELTRRDFMKGMSGVALGVATSLPSSMLADARQTNRSRVVLIRDSDVISGTRDINTEIVHTMLDQAMTALFQLENPADCWRHIIKPTDVVGIKTNVWRYLPTPPSVEQWIRNGLLQAGVAERDIDQGDRDVLRRDAFRRSTALINTRPMRTHSWSGVGSLIKNYIMFDRPQDYHDDACARLAELWELPMVKGKTRLNVLVMLTPQFHNIGPHHFDTSYIWPYGGLIVSTDPVAADAIGLHVIQQKRRLEFGEDRPLQPTAHHIALADTEYGLGNADTRNIELVRLGWEGGSLI